MAAKLLCYISHARVDTDFVYQNIIPILQELEIEISIAREQILEGDSIRDSIIRGILKTNLIICLFNQRSTYVNLEIGTAIGNNKPVIAILNEDYHEAPTDLKYLHYITYNDKTLPSLTTILKNTIERISESVIDKAAFLNNPGKKIVGIQIENGDYETQLLFTADVIEFVKSLASSQDVELLQASKGSLRSLISINLKHWADLAEKLIFIIPELKKRKVERLKVEAEIERIKAETNHITSETRIKQAEAFISLLERYKKLGFKVQVASELLITHNQDGEIVFKQPPRIE